MTEGGALDRWLDSDGSFPQYLFGIDRAAVSDAPVLILGESGTGRSTLARSLHSVSPRSSGPLVEVDPGVVPADLFEGDLFGFKRGAFTGATEDSPGRLGRAEGGALLFDHVEELPLTTQSKLLRLIAEKKYSPLGGTEVSADLRFLAVASPDLAWRAERGAFRADLFYRLEVLAFRLPPLRERLEELPRLAARVLEDLGARLNRPHLQLSPQAKSWMVEYSWPGNLRQLRNLLEREIVLQGEGILDPPRPSEVSQGAPRSLAEVEEEQIRTTLAFTRGHQGRAASLLGISRKALWQKRRRLGIP
ncbi:MAG: sigma 54-interacting transcriptional regulator [Deltaproteobacteria bacterium]|nr:sigma 54-interacting transcriptional regulator [Deltaproteobacteria bacterium]